MGSTIEGSQYDAKGNLKNWWTKADREKFDARTKCVEDQYADYIVVDDIHINSKLTLGEDVADLGGEILAYMAWQDATKGQSLQPRDGLTPEQRFFVGFAQWACENERPEELRVARGDRSSFPGRVPHQRRGREYAGVRQGLCLQGRSANDETCPKRSARSGRGAQRNGDLRTAQAMREQLAESGMHASMHVPAAWARVNE